ncbi:hypothetical protein D9M68_20120 [compost metagenome]
MVPLLVSSLSLEEVIETSITDAVGSCFSNIPGLLVGRMVDQYNHSGAENLIDAVVGSIHYTLDEYDSAELFTRLFVRLVEANADSIRHLISLEHWPAESTIVVKQQARKAPDPVKTLMEDYRHAREQGDYYPERLRRAFDEVESSM